MADDLKKKDGRDRAKVNTNEQWEIDQVTKKLGVTPADVKETVKKVGPVRKRVEEELKKKR